ncbi:TPA: hypothetical protein NHR53_006074 [Pseudomonas aeruginosa]|nr:hypothetical protein [Pseudomonas aeruginosa]HCE8129482.1 hypothetical protein [Pseudomonas aeruginosa]HCF0447690.1 hypothetical protein [Pseudomonas aeruginosa]
MKKPSSSPKHERSSKSKCEKVLEKLGGPDVVTPDPDHGGGGGDYPVDYNPHPVIPKPKPIDH